MDCAEELDQQLSEQRFLYGCQYRVTIGFPFQAPGTLSVIDPGGKVLINLPVNADAGTLDLGHLPPGLYILKLTSEKGVLLGKLLRK
jgi:hypothetical protein